MDRGCKLQVPGLGRSKVAGKFSIGVFIALDEVGMGIGERRKKVRN
jgi:hypothetical protein